MDQFHDPLPHGAASKNTVNTVLGHVSQVGNSMLSLLSGLLAAALVLYSGYVLYDTFYTQSNAGNSWELLQYRPEIIDDGVTPLSGGNSLAAINEDYRAWLTVYDTNIDYPVMQADNDLYYASHDVYGKVSLTGAIYLAAGNTRGMTDSYNLIYGHHMDNGAMFGALDSFANRSYFDSHREGVLVTSSGVYDLTVFAVAETDAYENEIYSVGNRMDDVLRFLRDPGDSTRTLFFDESAAADADRVVALSTCASAETNGRLVVFAKMTRHGLLTLQATGYGDTYDAQPHGLSNITTNYPEGTTFAYSTDGGQTWTTTPPTLTNVGTLTVIVRATNDVYGTSETTQTIQVNPAPVVVTALDARKSAGTDDPEFRAVVTGLVDDQQIIYTISRPGAGTDEDEGEYAGAIIAAGEELQGNYIVTYVPGTLTITAAEESIEDATTPLAEFFQPFQPRGGSHSAAWALVNLICLLVTAYIFLPLLHLKAKFGRVKTMKKLNAEKTALREAVELDEVQRAERDRIYDMAIQTRAKDGETVSAADITEKEFGNAVEALYYHVSKFLKRFWVGFGLEVVTVAAAIIAFVLTEDMRLPMILIDKWTPLMAILMLACWGFDLWLMRYRDKVPAEEESEKETVGAAQ